MNKLDIFNEQERQDIIEQQTVIHRLFTLAKHIENNTLAQYEHFDWLGEQVDLLLNYPHDSDERPDELRRTFYECLQKTFPYEGKIFHGFVSYDIPNDILANYRGIVSYSKDLMIAYSFATITDGCDVYNTVIMEETDEGFDLHKFLVTVKPYINIESLDTFINEKEILCYHKLANYVSFDCKDKTITDIKLEVEKGRVDFSKMDRTYAVILYNDKYYISDTYHNDLLKDLYNDNDIITESKIVFMDLFVDKDNNKYLLTQEEKKVIHINMIAIDRIMKEYDIKHIGYFKDIRNIGDYILYSDLYELFSKGDSRG